LARADNLCLRLTFQSESLIILISIYKALGCTIIERRLQDQQEMLLRGEYPQYIRDDQVSEKDSLAKNDRPVHDGFHVEAFRGIAIPNPAQATDFPSKKTVNPCSLARAQLPPLPLSQPSTFTRSLRILP
jgi:hypothetical protein